MFLLFFQILGSFVLILFLWQLWFWPRIRHMYIYHPRGVFLGGYGRFEGLKEKFYTVKFKFVYITFCLLMELCCSWRFWWHRPYFIVKFVPRLCILFIHYPPMNLFWVLASSLAIVLNLFLIFWVIWASVFL